VANVNVNVIAYCGQKEVCFAIRIDDNDAVYHSCATVLVKPCIIMRHYGVSLWCVIMVFSFSDVFEGLRIIPPCILLLIFYPVSFVFSVVFLWNDNWLGNLEVFLRGGNIITMLK